MDPIGEEKIARLLRLKRYEQPPPGYFENFLLEFRRRRRRDELLREPLWSICVERVRDFVFRHNIRTLAGYCAGVVTAAACIVVIAFTLFPKPYNTQLVQISPIPTTSRIVAEGFNFAPSVFAPPFDIRPILLPGTRRVPVLAHSLRSDESVPLELEWDLVDEESPLDE